MSIPELYTNDFDTQNPGAGAITVVNAQTMHATFNKRIGVLIQIDRTDTTSETIFTFVTTIGTFVRTFKQVSEGGTKFFYENEHFVEAGETVTITVESSDTDDDDVDFEVYIYDVSLPSKLALSVSTMVEGTVSHDNTAATSTVIYSDDITEATADHYNGRRLLFTSGAMVGQATAITDYALVAGEGEFTVVALAEAPADNVTFIIV